MTRASVRHFVVDEADWFDVSAALTVADIALVEVADFGDQDLPRRYTALFCRKEVPANDFSLEDLRRIAAQVKTMESSVAFARRCVLLIVGIAVLAFVLCLLDLRHFTVGDGLEMIGLGTVPFVLYAFYYTLLRRGRKRGGKS